MGGFDSEFKRFGGLSIPSLKIRVFFYSWFKDLGGFDSEFKKFRGFSIPGLKDSGGFRFLVIQGSGVLLILKFFEIHIWFIFVNNLVYIRSF